MTELNISDRVVIITGGVGMLGEQYVNTVLSSGGIPIILDINEKKINQKRAQLNKKYPDTKFLSIKCDITDIDAVREAREHILSKYQRIDALINNANNNANFSEYKIGEGNSQWTRLERFPIEIWNQDIAVGLTGAFICSQVFGQSIALTGRGVILNISSDLSVIGPDQRLYKLPGLKDDEQPVKPVSYSVVKSGLLGLTRYLATYWRGSGMRANTISLGGVYTSDLDTEFVARIRNLIPLDRMATLGEYNAAILFMISDASQYINGQNIVIDGGRTIW